MKYCLIQVVIICAMFPAVYAGTDDVFQHISVSVGPEENVELGQVYSLSEIVNNDLNVTMVAYIHIKNTSAPIRFDLIPRGLGGETGNIISMVACAGGPPLDFPFEYPTCSQIIRSKFYPNDNDKVGQLEIYPDFEEPGGVFVIANYLMPEHIFRQGDYHVAWISYEFHEKTKITNYVVLPKQSSELYRFPENSKTYPIEKGEKWVVEFEGGFRDSIWYSDANERKQESEKLQRKYAIVSAILGAIVALISSFVIPLISPSIAWIKKKLSSFIRKLKGI